MQAGHACWRLETGCSASSPELKVLMSPLIPQPPRSPLTLWTQTLLRTTGLLRPRYSLLLVRACLLLGHADNAFWRLVNAGAGGGEGEGMPHARPGPY